MVEIVSTCTKVEYCETMTYQCWLGHPTSPQNVVMRSLDLDVDTEESKLDLEALVECQTPTLIEVARCGPFHAICSVPERW